MDAPPGPLVTIFKPKDAIYQQHPLKKSKTHAVHILARTLCNVCLVSCVRDPIKDNVAN